MPPRTHLAIDPRLVGTVLEIGEGSASVVLVCFIPKRHVLEGA
jgi:hypothetical protein